MFISKKTLEHIGFVERETSRGYLFFERVFEGDFRITLSESDLDRNNIEIFAWKGKDTLAGSTVDKDAFLAGLANLYSFIQMGQAKNPHKGV